MIFITYNNITGETDFKFTLPVKKRFENFQKNSTVGKKDFVNFPLPVKNYLQNFPLRVKKIPKNYDCR